MEYIIIFFIPFFFCLVGAFINFDRLMRILYIENRELWEANGRPCGFFWKPKECAGMFYNPKELINLLPSYAACNRLAFELLFKTPNWIKGNKRAEKYLFRLRILVLLWNLGIISIFIAYCASKC